MIKKILAGLGLALLLNSAALAQATAPAIKNAAGQPMQSQGVICVDLTGAYVGCGSGGPGGSSPYIPTGAATRSVSTSSARVALPSADQVVLLTNNGTVDINYKFGDVTVTAATTDYLLPAGRSIAVSANSNTYVAAIAATGSSSLSVTTGTGTPVIAGGGGGGGISGTTSNASSGVATSSTNVATVAYNYCWNGATWDQCNGTLTAPTAQSFVYPSTNVSGTPTEATPETCSSGNVANATAACTLATAVGKTTYITGFNMSSDGATAALGVTCTLTGPITGTMSYTYDFGVITAQNQPLNVQFPIPIPASATNTTIVASCPASGTGGLHAAMTATGFVK